MKAIVAALGLAAFTAASAVATATSAAPSTPFVAGVGPALAAAAPEAAAPAGIEVAGGYGRGYGYGHGYGYGYGRPYHGRPHILPYPYRPRPHHGYYGRPRTRIVERPCSTKVVERTPYGKLVTVYRHCGRRW